MLLVMCCSVLTCAPFASAQETLRRIQPAEQRVAQLIARGRAESPTFRRLTDDLEAADWLMFIQSGRCPDRSADGCLLHRVGHFEGRLYLRVLVTVDGRRPNDVVATLAHELYHAYEVVSDGTVTDDQTLASFTKRIASSRFQASNATLYETKAARRINQMVLRELRKPSGSKRSRMRPRL